VSHRGGSTPGGHHGAEQIARFYIREHLPAVEAVARELAHRGRLTGTEIEAIVERSTGRVLRPVKAPKARARVPAAQNPYPWR
jgi:hypothetical protein